MHFHISVVDKDPPNPRHYIVRSREHATKEAQLERMGHTGVTMRECHDNCLGAEPVSKELA